MIYSIYVFYIVISFLIAYFICYPVPLLSHQVSCLYNHKGKGPLLIPLRYFLRNPSENLNSIQLRSWFDQIWVKGCFITFSIFLRPSSRCSENFLCFVFLSESLPAGVHEQNTPKVSQPLGFRCANYFFPSRFVLPFLCVQ